MSHRRCLGLRQFECLFNLVDIRATRGSGSPRPVGSSALARRPLPPGAVSRADAARGRHGVGEAVLLHAARSDGPVGWVRTSTALRARVTFPPPTWHSVLAISMRRGTEGAPCGCREDRISSTSNRMRVPAKPRRGGQLIGHHLGGDARRQAGPRDTTRPGMRFTRREVRSTSNLLCGAVAPQRVPSQAETTAGPNSTPPPSEGEGGEREGGAAALRVRGRWRCEDAPARSRRADRCRGCESQPGEATDTTRRGGRREPMARGRRTQG